MILRDSVRIRASPEAIFRFFEEVESNYARWHPDHVLFRWVSGRGLEEGQVAYFEEHIAGKLLKQRVVYTRVDPDRYIEFAPTSWLLRIVLPRMLFRIEPENDHCRFTAEIHVRIGPIGARLNRKELDAVRRHMSEEGENLKRILEGEGPPFRPATHASTSDPLGLNQNRRGEVMNPTTDHDRIHRAVSKDGTEIAARVHGAGPPIVLLAAGPGDSETSWHRIVLFLSKRFTCYLLETRGRGSSDDHPDHSPDRQVEDVEAFVESLGEPVGLVGWGSALWARVAAREAAAVFAVVVYEPGAGEVMGKEPGERMGEVFAGVAELVAEGRLVDAARAFIEGGDVIYSEKDLATGAPLEFWEAAAARLPLFLQEQKQAAGSGQPGPTSPSMLGKITMPVLLLHGDRSSQWFSDSVEHVAEHLADATVRQISGAAHFGPYTHPRSVADEMSQFFTDVHARVPAIGRDGIAQTLKSLSR